MTKVRELSTKVHQPLSERQRSPCKWLASAGRSPTQSLAVVTQVDSIASATPGSRSFVRDKRSVASSIARSSDFCAGACTTAGHAQQKRVCRKAKAERQGGGEASAGDRE